MNNIEKSFYDLIKAQAADNPDMEAVIMGGQRLTYKELVHRIDGVASVLLGKGLKKGDKAAVWSFSSPAWLYAFLGIIRAGGIAVLLNANLPLKDVKPLLDFADTKYLLFGKTHDFEGHTRDAGIISEYTGLDEASCISILDEDFTYFQYIEPCAAGRNVRDDAYMIYTSGTTAFPKAVINSQYAMVNQTARIIRELSPLLGRRGLIGVPFFHVYALMGIWAYLGNGGTVIIPEAIKADHIAELVGKEDVTDIWSVAVIFQSIIDSEKLTAMVAPRARLCAVAGSYTSPVQFMRFEASLYHATFINMYGMTETSAAYVLTKPGDDASVRYNTVGKPVDGAETKIWDDARGMLPAGEVGEIITRGYHLKNGYYKLPSEKQAVDRDGWLHSGDMGVFDADGNLRIVGRIKDLIIKGGENVAPAEIEAGVMSHPSIGSCRVFGYKDRIYGENIGACVTLAPGAHFDEETIRSYVKGKLGSYKSPVYYFVFDRFPLNANGKIDQRNLHIEMLRRLHTLLLEDKLERGIPIISISAKNSMYNITPIASMFEESAVNLGFSKKKSLRIRQAVEELLILRINESASDIEDIDISLQYFKTLLRITVSDFGKENTFEHDEQRKMALALLLKLVDDYDMIRLDSGKYQTRIDFAYDKNFDITSFLMKHEAIV